MRELRQWAGRGQRPFVPLGRDAGSHCPWESIFCAPPEGEARALMIGARYRLGQFAGFFVWYSAASGGEDLFTRA
ncbi:hypothetical protein [Roseobacter fucihabitans]|uniref:hypothetical protein n=1 Tax=Roseobacter fucihabitans TaxID=1537242 RepID=UPI00165305FF|nr:hypothetical protein [Roseobacter litoralis]